MRGILFYLAAGLGCFSANSLATDYIYRDLMANTLPSVQCNEKADAVAAASKAYTMNRYSKKFCQTQGYGWHVEAIKASGTPVCNECSDKPGKYQCFVQDVRVTCKRIKPGSVGMLPGQS